MKISISNQEVVFFAFILLPNGETGSLEFEVDGWGVKLNIIFIENKDNPEQSISISSENDCGLVSFINWNNSLGSATKKPFQLGETQTKRPLLLMASHHLIGTVNQLQMQFMLGDTKWVEK